MIDLAAVYQHLNMTGWSIVERDDKTEITLPDGMRPPTEKQIAQAWSEIQLIRESEEVERARKERYERETDHLLFEALAKLDLPELKAWQDAREAVKTEFPKERL